MHKFISRRQKTIGTVNSGTYVKGIKKWVHVKCASEMRKFSDEKCKLVSVKSCDMASEVDKNKQVR